MSAAEDGAPVLRVLRGTPTPEELAALVGVLVGRVAHAAASAGVHDAPVRSAWADRGALLGAAPVAGPGAWRRSGLPR